jgi:1-acyl-sn-glycerol-3-phosphate acyltransferase
MKWYCGFGFWIIGAKLIEEKYENMEVFKKWLGPDYHGDFDSPYSVIISNHVGWYEVQYLMYKVAPGFVAKEAFKNAPFIGRIAEYLESIWIDRSNYKSRENTCIELQKRQKDYIAGRSLSPVMVFPEGTTSSGYHIIKLRKGAFELLQPLKSILVKTLTPGYDLAEGISSMGPKFLLSMSKFYHILKITELPVIYPTEYMFSNYMKINPELTNRAEVYAEVVREIWCEIGGFQKSESTFKNYLEYLSVLFDQKIHNT